LRRAAEAGDGLPQRGLRTGRREFEFHPEHNHWHIGNTALLEVRQGSPRGPVVGGNSIKTTFCLIDAYKLVGNQPTRDRLFWDCYASYQGIAPG
jgi:hypothetical protein